MWKTVFEESEINNSFEKFHAQSYFRERLNRNPYSLLASPKRPLTFSELPSEIQNYLEPIRFTSANFAEAQQLLSETDFPENNWSAFDESLKD